MGWYHPDWTYRQKVIIDATKVDAVFQVFPIYTSKLNLDFWDRAKAGAADVRITQADGTTEVARYVASHIPGTPETNVGCILADVHADVSISTNSYYWIYYGNAAASDYSASATYGRNNALNNYSQFYLPGMSLTDLTGGGRDLTATGSPGTAASGYEGITAASYNGSGQYHGATPALTTQPLTMEALAYSTDLSSNQAITSFTLSSSNNDYAFLYFNGLSTDGIAADFKGTSGSTGSSATSTDYTTSSWRYAAGSRSGNIGTGVAYLDGGGSGSDSTTIAANTAFDRFSIGVLRISAGDFTQLTGRVAFVGVSNSVRSANYISTMNNAWADTAFFSAGAIETATGGTTGWILFQLAATTSASGSLADWSNPNNALSVNADVATASIDPSGNYETETLKLTNPAYGITIPSGQTTYGAKFRVRHSKNTSGSRVVEDLSCKFIDNTGAIVGSELGVLSGNWPLAATNVDYTSAGVTLSDSKFTSSSGLAFSATATNSSGVVVAQIITAWMQVTWDTPVADSTASGAGLIGAFVGSGVASSPSTASGAGVIGAFVGSGDALVPSTASGGGVIGDFIGEGSAPVESLDATASGGGVIGGFIGAGVASLTAVDSTASGAGVIGEFIGSGISITDIPQSISGDALEWLLTGAASEHASQRDPDASLGGYRSGTPLRCMTWDAIDPMVGLEVLEIGGGNGRGTGALNAIDDGTVTWTPPNGAAGVAVALAYGDETTLYGFGGNGWVKVRRRSTLPLVGSHSVKCIDLLNNAIGFGNVASADAISGKTYYRAVIGANRLTVPISGIRVWLDADASAGLAIAYEDLIDGALETVADEFTEPSGMAWNTGTTRETGLILPGLAPGDGFGLRIRRTIGADADPEPNVLNHIHVEVSDLENSYLDALRGMYRVAREDYETWGVWIGQDTEPDLDGPPDALFTSAPYTTSLGLDHDHTYYVVIRWRNKWGLWSPNIESKKLVMNADGELDPSPPSAPSLVTITQTADNQVVVGARYEPAPDGDNRGEIFVIWITSDESEPDDFDPPSGYVVMGRRAGVEVCKFTDTAELLDETPVKVLVKTRRLAVLAGESFSPDVTQLPSSGAGTIVVGHEISGWAASGFAKVLDFNEKLGEVFRYDSLVVGSGISTFTVPSDGRGIWGTTAAATVINCVIYPISKVDSKNEESVSGLIDGMAPARPWGDLLFGDFAGQQQAPIAGPDGLTPVYISAPHNIYLLLGEGWCELWMDTVLVWKVFQDGHDLEDNGLYIPEEWDLITAPISGAGTGVFEAASATSLYLCAGNVRRMHFDAGAMTITVDEISTAGGLPEVAPQSSTWEQYAGSLLQSWDPAREDYRPYARLSGAGVFTSQWDINNSLSQAEVLAL